MRILVLGGTVFLSRAVAADAVTRGHDVVCACRGTSGSVPDGAELAKVDRDDGLPDLGTFDAVVDVAQKPSWVRSAVQAQPAAHWVFVSTLNVYPDHTTPRGTPGSLDVHEPEHDDLDPRSTPEVYGAMKVACEQTVRDGTTSATVLRPGLIVGPGDPSGRFTYWPHRLRATDRRPEVLAPGDPADVMQVIDVRDLAAWIVTAAEHRTTGTYDAVGEPMPIQALLALCAEGVGVDPTWTWVHQDFLTEHEVAPWSGPEGIPLWLPRPAYDGMPDHDPAPAQAAGLTLRPVAETAADVARWLAETPDAEVTGIDPDREAALLAAWHDRTQSEDG